MRCGTALLSSPRLRRLSAHWWKAATLACLLALLLPTVTSIQAQQAGKSSGVEHPAASSPLTNQQVEEKVNALLSKMTLEEKIGQLTQLPGAFFPGAAKPDERVRKGEGGSILWLTDPAAINRIQRVAVEESRLHIPILFGLDVIHGFRTIFPVPLGMASSWDPSLVEQVQSVAAQEASAAGIRWTFGPMVDIARDPRWGRIVEGAGEDPFLGAAMAQAQVRGFQGPYLGSPDHLLACAKHFAGYGAADGGRDYDSSYIPEDWLRNVYLVPFHAAVEVGVGSLMSAYMDLNDVPATGNRFLLHDVLRGDWGFRGFVVSDAFSVQGLVTHGFARNARDAAYRALTAGLNMDMASNTFFTNLGPLVQEGRISMAQIDEAVRPILAVKIRLGLFEHPYVDESRIQEVLNAPEHRQLARVAAQRSMVLLRNENQLLPLKKNISSIAVIGPLADSPQDTEGSWTVSREGSQAVTVLQGIRNKLGSGVRIEYAKGPDIKRDIPSFFDALMPGPKPPAQTPAEAEEAFNKALETARRAEVAVLVLGELANMSGEAASRSSLVLPGRQEQLLEAVVSLGKPVVLVLISGRPLDLAWASEHVPAILEAWYPGTEGGNAVADIFFGDSNPGGKLPVTFPRSVGQVPIYYAHNLTHQPETSPGFKSRYWDDLSSPLYPFGYGLSYTQFAFSNLQLSQPQVKLGQELKISVDVENTGDRAGDEVVQLYIHQRAGSASRPVRQLKGFERIALTPGEKKTVHFALGKEELSFWSTQEKKWLEEPENFDLWVGADSTATLHTSFKVNP
jgi:beta-glucosidase